MNEKAVFAAGCFWGVEAAFRRIQGVVSTRVGYTGGKTPDPSYEEVCTGKTGHAEAVEVVYDSERVSYRQLLDVLWGIHDPTTRNRQGPDVGSQYRSAIFYTTEGQRTEASASVGRLQTSGRYGRAPIVTEIVPAGVFHQAEAYHQQYLEKGGRASCRTH